MCHFSMKVSVSTQRVMLAQLSGCSSHLLSIRSSLPGQHIARALRPGVSPFQCASNLSCTRHGRVIQTLDGVPRHCSALMHNAPTSWAREGAEVMDVQTYQPVAS